MGKRERLLALVIDCNCLCHISRSVFSSLIYDDQRVGVIFGFLRQLFQLGKKFQPDLWAFCWDSVKSYRRAIFPEYKAKRRERTPQEQREDELAYTQFDELRESILPALGFKNIYQFVGLEADDLIALLVRDESHRAFDKIVVGTDRDLCQVLREDCSLYSPITKVGTTFDGFASKYGVSPGVWNMIRAISGCGGDGIPGVVGVGEKTAIKYWCGELKESSKICKRIREAEGGGLIDRNERLMNLPFRTVYLPSMVSDSLCFKSFVEVFDRYHLESFLRQAEQWKQVFRMK